MTGEGNHGGTTLTGDRRDPMVAAGAIVGAVRDIARSQPDARATVGRLVPLPGGTNVIASRVDLWLDARHPDDAVTAAVVAAIGDRAAAIAAEEGCTVTLLQESVSPTVKFDLRLRDRLSASLPAAPLLPTRAGHDAGVLAAEVPTGWCSYATRPGCRTHRASTSKTPARTPVLARWSQCWATSWACHARPSTESGRQIECFWLR